MTCEQGLKEEDHEKKPDVCDSYKFLGECLPDREQSTQRISYARIGEQPDMDGGSNLHTHSYTTDRNTSTYKHAHQHTNPLTARRLWAG